MATGPQVHVLANGLTVLVHEDDRFPLVSTRLFVRAGSVHEAREQAGISHLLEHMVFKGTARRTQGQAATDVESLGGELNAATGFDSTMYIVDLPAEHWAMGLDVIQDMIFNAIFDPEELESERPTMTRTAGYSNPFRNTFGQGHPMPGRLSAFRKRFAPSPGTTSRPMSGPATNRRTWSWFCAATCEPKRSWSRPVGFSAT